MINPPEIFAHIHNPDKGLDRVSIATTHSLDEYEGVLVLAGPEVKTRIGGHTFTDYAGLFPQTYVKVSPHAARALLAALDVCDDLTERMDVDETDLAALRMSLDTLVSLA